MASNCFFGVIQFSRSPRISEHKPKTFTVTSFKRNKPGVILLRCQWWLFRSVWDLKLKHSASIDMESTTSFNTNHNCTVFHSDHFSHDSFEITLTLPPRCLKCLWLNPIRRNLHSCHIQFLFHLLANTCLSAFNISHEHCGGCWGLRNPVRIATGFPFPSVCFSVLIM